jgi:hypothetical protein
MKDPVVAESEMTYERQAIEQWFEACQQQGREPTCPVSGQIVQSTKVQPNVVLQRTIQEWTRRNAVICMRVAAAQLNPASSVKFSSLLCFCNKAQALFLPSVVVKGDVLLILLLALSPGIKLSIRLS